MVREWRIRAYLRGTGQAARRCRKRPDDRRDPSEGPSYRLQPQKGGDEPRLIGRAKGGLNTKLHALCDNTGRPVRLHLNEGQRSDFKGADVLLKDSPKAVTLIGDRGYDSNKIRKMLAEQKIEPCIPPRKNRKETIEYCKAAYKTRHKVENLFAKLKDWQRIATRYDRCAHTFRSAIYIAATIIFWL